MDWALRPSFRWSFIRSSTIAKKSGIVSRPLETRSLTYTWNWWRNTQRLQIGGEYLPRYTYTDTPTHTTCRFIAVFIPMVALSFVTVLYWPTHLTWWALIIAFLIGIFFLVSWFQEIIAHRLVIPRMSTKSIRIGSKLVILLAIQRWILPEMCQFSISNTPLLQSRV